MTLSTESEDPERRRRYGALLEKTEEEKAAAAAAQKEREAARAAEAQRAAEEKAARDFARSPQGRARTALERGDELFQFSLDLQNTQAMVSMSMGSPRRGLNRAPIRTRF